MHVCTNDVVILQSNSIANNVNRLLNKSMYDTVRVIMCYVHRGKGFK